jgi:3-oxoacyl-[acyl-carrier protein] reductase
MLEWNFSGKICVVTGAGRGIGKAIANAIAEIGAHVICVSKSEGSCGKAAAEIRERGLSAEHMAVDVSSAEEVSGACKEILKNHSAVDILVNNAGITSDNLLLRMSSLAWDSVMATNLSSCFHWTKNLLYQMIKKRWGRIVNVSSVVGIVGNAGQANYAAAKAGLIGFTKSVAREVATRGITVNAVAPGFIQTDMTDVLGESAIAGILENIPMGKLGRAEDVAGAVRFLCSDDARYITGQILNINGGMVM